MKVKKNQKLNKKVIFCLIVFIFCSISSFSQGWSANSFDNPTGVPRDEDPPPAPIGNSVLVLLVLSATFGFFKMQSQNTQ
jgi:hypothetical protein